MSQVISMAYDRWMEAFGPTTNHLNGNASFDGCLYETYGSEYDHVCQVAEKTPDRIWTVLDCDGVLVIGNGLHFVNRMGYIITERPALPETEYAVFDDDEDLDDDIEPTHPGPRLR